MSGDIEIDDPDVSEGASENEYSDNEHEVGREEDDMKFRPDDENGKVGGSTVVTKPKLDPKDPLRPRRKKARRACFACQRAHLTCGKYIYVSISVLFSVPRTFRSTSCALRCTDNQKLIISFTRG
jgi:hypothetical protein